LQDKGYTTSLIQTKLHRPPLPVDMVRRPRLTKWLKQHQSRSMTLISAPAGYGKSTLISCWLESVDCPFAWVSLDEHDNELGGFLSYFLAAIQSIFPYSMPETQAMLMATPPPPIPVVAKELVNEIDQLEGQFILVLDDYQLIENQTIHDLLNELLLHQPRNLHLELGTRMDPPLPLVTLRANSQVTEIRVPDLRFAHCGCVYDRRRHTLDQNPPDASLDDHPHLHPGSGFPPCS
jgi:LuxR family maltose regulon positive regulatory protein